MPLFMKFLVVHGLFFFAVGVIMVFPGGTRRIAGNVVSYSEWWSSYAGLTFSVVAFGLGAGVTSLLKKLEHARRIYFGVLCGAFVVVLISNSALLGRADWSIPSVIYLCAIYWYLFHKKSVNAYFDASDL